MGLARMPMALAVCGLLIAPSTVVAASNELTAAVVSPPNGTTDTTFVLSVHYGSPNGFAATRVVARVADRTFELSLVAGSADAGVFQATVQLPAGSWPVTFEATAARGKSPTLLGPTVVVSVPPVATSQPVPAPPAAPPPPAAPMPAPPTAQPVAPAPTQAEVPAQPVAPPAASAAPEPETTARESADPSPGDAAAGVFVGTPGGEAVPVDAATVTLSTVPWGLFALGLAGLGLVLGLRLLLASRRRPEPVAELVRFAAPAPAVAVKPPRKLAAWELSALDDEPIGTVESLGRP